MQKTVFANNNLFIIQGNNFTDSNVIISLLENIPGNLDEEYSNEIIKVLNESNLFSDVRVNFIDNKYNIIVKEYPNIRKIYFENNERLEDDELRIIANDLGLTNLNSKSLNLFINETKKFMNPMDIIILKLNIMKNIMKILTLLIYILILMRVKLLKLIKLS